MIIRHLLTLVTLLLIGPLAFAADNKIAPTLDSVEVTHNGETLTITRGADRDATLPEPFQKTDRGCPPFCVQPMQAVPGVATIGELEVLDYLSRIHQGDDSILVVDSRTPDWVMRGTIPGSVNIPWNRLNTDFGGNLEQAGEADSLTRIMTERFGASQDPATGQWRFADAKTLVLFCNGIWCAQSTANIKTLVGHGYPVDKLKWYRGGMQDWLSAGLTSVTPE
ncbi:MAG: rhodanese-like domain-containing protein [Halochromatium sp.]|uniref:rhodanese-like domain-containing protein n=1 Tax=Halochromatium sp. TaxID=2049430 RepID=UPI00397B9CAE